MNVRIVPVEALASWEGQRLHWAKAEIDDSRRLYVDGSGGYTMAEHAERLGPWMAPDAFPYEADFIIQRKDGGRLDGIALVWGYARNAVVCGKSFAVTLDDKELVARPTAAELDEDLEDRLVFQVQAQLIKQLPSAER